MIDTILQDVRYAARLLARSPGFTAVAVLTLALAIAVNTTVFSWVNAVLLAPVPGITDGHPLYTLETIRADGRTFSYPDYLDCRANLHSLAGVAASQELAAFDIGGPESPQRVWGEMVTNNYFAVLGVQPVKGRFFHPEENGEKDLVAVISYRLWQSYFRGDPGIAGTVVRVNRTPLTIIGVAPRVFGGAWRGLAFDMWVPLTMGVQLNQVSRDILDYRGARGLQTTARLKPGVTLEQARAEARLLGERLSKTYAGTNLRVGFTVLPEEKASNNVKGLLIGPFRILMAMCCVVLLIACANVANLLLARATARQKELSLRVALGATGERIARQLLTEALLLAAIGAAIGVPLAMWARHALSLLVPPTELPIYLEVPFNGTVLAFSVLACVAAAVISGLVPALHAARPDLTANLKEGGGGGGTGARAHRMRDLLVVGEVALALVALAGAGLFLESFRRVSALDPGFDPHNVLLSKFFLSPSGYTTFAQRGEFMWRLRQRLEALPDVVGVTYAESIPLGFQGAPGCDVKVAGYTPPPGENKAIDRNLIAPGFFHLLRIPVLNGREFTSADDLKAAPVAVVNAAFVRHFLGGRDPVGMQIYGCGTVVTVVGLVQDSKYYSLAEVTKPVIYVPFPQRYEAVGDYDRGIGLLVRARGENVPTQALLRRAVAAVDPGVGVFGAMAFEDYAHSSVFPQKVAASLLSVLGLIALLLAGAGLYSVMAYVVSQRTHEIGIRMALGGQRSSVLAIILKKGMGLTLIGLVAGLAAALSMTQVVASLLLNVSARDPLVFAGAALFLMLVALLANFAPARRAMQVDPLVALHYE
ncbi:MAG: ABC transporter permease [Bryobacteraceae bacterium]|jgi:predicted permease